MQLVFVYIAFDFCRILSETEVESLYDSGLNYGVSLSSQYDTSVIIRTMSYK